MTPAEPPDTVEQVSPLSFDATLERLTQAIEKAGLTIFARIDHAANARKAGLKMPPATVLIYGEATISDYSETAGAMRRFAAGANHAQPGDPAKLARALLQIVDADDPPLRIPFGGDTVSRIEAKNAFVACELTKWRELSLSTGAD